MKSLMFLLDFLVLIFITSGTKSTYPNIVFIIADDLGWNDVSLHGSDQIQTPNIDLMGYTGVKLRRYYSCSVCTPSRSSLLTGKYAHVLGMQGRPLAMSEDRGIPVNETLLPQYLKAAGYKTHLVGKWHVGDSREAYLPTERGFDSHFGHRGGYMDYYEYTLQETFSTGPVAGLTLFRNKTPAWDVQGYITDVYNDEAKSVIKNHDISSPLFMIAAHNAPHSGDTCAPLQAPPEVVRQMRHVELPSRRLLAATMKKLDDGVGEIFNALNEKGILNDTIIIFMADNGGMTSGEHVNYASNWPLRGTKTSPFEGGVRVVGMIWNKALIDNNQNHYWDGYMHVSDWLPTLLSAAGIEIPEGIDGVDQWENINTNSNSSRNEMYEIDDYAGFASIIYGNYKLITGNVSVSSATYQGKDLRGIIGKAPSYKEALLNSTGYSVFKSIGVKFDVDDLSLRDKFTLSCSNNASTINCTPGKGKVCLYNIIEDPCETTDLSESYPDLVLTMQALLDSESAKIIPRNSTVYRDPLAVPSLHNYTWSTWIES